MGSCGGGNEKDPNRSDAKRRFVGRLRPILFTMTVFIRFPKAPENTSLLSTGFVHVILFIRNSAESFRVDPFHNCRQLNASRLMWGCGTTWLSSLWRHHSFYSMDPIRANHAHCKHITFGFLRTRLWRCWRMFSVYQMDKWLNMQRKVIIERTKVARIEIMKLIGRKRAADCTHFFFCFVSFVWKWMHAIHTATMPPVIVSSFDCDGELCTYSSAICDTTYHT